MRSIFEQLSLLSDADWAGANPLSPTFRDNPYPALKILRETEPVNQTPIGPWRISRYDNIPKTFKSAPTSVALSDGSNPNFNSLDWRGSFLEFMLNKDGDAHMRLRRLVVKAFTRKALEDMQREIDQAVDGAISKGIAAGGMAMIQD
jgi:cytochrome P450